MSVFVNLLSRGYLIWPPRFQKSWVCPWYQGKTSGDAESPDTRPASNKCD